MVQGVTTEWEDIQVKMGGYAAVEKGPTDFEDFQETIDQVEHYDPKNNMTKKQLDELIEDDPDFEEDDVMKELQEKRLNEMKATAALAKFGYVHEINKPEWEAHITNATKGVNVVIHLYQTYNTECTLLNKCLDILAPKYPTTKFVKAIATKCIENFKDRDLPALLFYKDGAVTGKIIPCGVELGGVRMNPRTVEFNLMMHKQIIPLEPFEEDPRDKLKLMNTVIHKKGAAGRQNMEDDLSSDGEDDREYMNNQMTRYK